MLPFLYIILAFAIQPSFSMLRREQHQKHGHWRHHHSHNESKPTSSMLDDTSQEDTSSILHATSSKTFSITPSFSIPSNTEPASNGPAISSSPAHSTPLVISSISRSLSPSFSKPSSRSTSTTTPTLSTETQIVGSHRSSTSNAISPPPPSSRTTSGSAFETSSGSYWQPTAGTTWQIQLSAPITDFSSVSSFSVVDLDLFDNSASTINTLHSMNIKVLCYFSAGTYENWRPDASSFGSSDLGQEVDGWAGEWWLNTNSANVRKIMTARIELARSQGCDGVDPDNVDAYDNVNGLSLTQNDAIDYVKFLADTAHSNGLAIGLKNAGDIVGGVLPSMQWEVNEQCVQYIECDLFTPFVAAGKPVFHIEYPTEAPDVSAQVKATSCSAPSGFSSVLKSMNLDAWIEIC